MLIELDLAQRIVDGHAMAWPSGVALNKNRLLTTIGTSNDGGSWVDETLRKKRRPATFDAHSVGLKALGLVQLAPQWKRLAGQRHDPFKGGNSTVKATAAKPAVPNPPALCSAIDAGGRSDGL